MDAGRSDSQRLSRVEATMARLTGTGTCELADKTVLVSVRVSSADLNLGGVEGVSNKISNSLCTRETCSGASWPSYIPLMACH